MMKYAEHACAAPDLTAQDRQRACELCGTPAEYTERLLRVGMVEYAAGGDPIAAELQLVLRVHGELVTSLQNMAQVARVMGMHAMTVMLAMTVARLTAGAMPWKAALRGAYALQALELPLAAGWLLKQVRTPLVHSP